VLACIAVAPSRDFALKWLDVLDASLPIADSLIRDSFPQNASYESASALT